MKIDLKLPLAAEALIPHRLPMRLVETLVSYGDAAGEIEACPGVDCILAGTDGSLDEVALLELMAQGYAVIKGYDDLLHGKEVSEGYLVGAKKFRVSGLARAADPLLVRIATIGSFEGFAVVAAEIEQAGKIIASGTIKLWIVNQANTSGGNA